MVLIRGNDDINKIQNDEQNTALFVLKPIRRGKESWNEIQSESTSLSLQRRAKKRKKIDQTHQTATNKIEINLPQHAVKRYSGTNNVRLKPYQSTSTRPHHNTHST